MRIAPAPRAGEPGYYLFARFVSDGILRRCGPTTWEALDALDRLYGPSSRFPAVYIPEFRVKVTAKVCTEQLCPPGGCVAFGCIVR